MYHSVTFLRLGEVVVSKMALPKPPAPLTEEERETLSEKFAEHEISEEQEQRQQRFREKLEDAE